MKISKTKSDKYWKQLHKKIKSDFENEKLWEEAYSLFDERLQLRYFIPIEAIEKNDDFPGKELAIMTIYCSSIEFLETTYQGINFRIGKMKLSKYEYTLENDEKIFTSFLTKRKPFLIKKNVAKQFYKSVRCGLLNEVKLGNNWKIQDDNPKVISENNGSFTVNRKIFGERLHQFLHLYKKDLMRDKKLKKAFIRKFDYLIEK